MVRPLAVKRGYTDFKTEHTQKMTCKIVLSKNILPRQEDLESIRVCFMRDIHMYIEMLKQELTYSAPMFLLSEGQLVRIKSDREKEILGKIQKVQMEYSEKYSPYISY